MTKLVAYSLFGLIFGSWQTHPTDSFVPPSVLNHRHHLTGITKLDVLPSFVISDEIQTIVDATASTVAPVTIDSDGGGGIGDVIKNIAIGGTILLMAFVGITVIAANVIIPKAAEQLEKDAKELAPELWDEYSAKLEPGELFMNRPDLIQELTIKMRPIIQAKLEGQLEENENFDETAAVVDAEVIETTKKEE